MGTFVLVHGSNSGGWVWKLELANRNAKTRVPVAE